MSPCCIVRGGMIIDHAGFDNLPNSRETSAEGRQGSCRETRPDLVYVLPSRINYLESLVLSLMNQSIPSRPSVDVVGSSTMTTPDTQAIRPSDASSPIDLVKMSLGEEETNYVNSSHWIAILDSVFLHDFHIMFVGLALTVEISDCRTERTLRRGSLHS